MQTAEAWHSHAWDGVVDEAGPSQARDGGVAEAGSSHAMDGGVDDVGPSHAMDGGVDEAGPSQAMLVDEESIVGKCKRLGGRRRVWSKAPWNLCLVGGQDGRGWR
jgi:hypothetical protein